MNRAGSYTWPFVTWALLVIGSTMLGLFLACAGVIAYATIRL